MTASMHVAIRVPVAGDGSVELTVDIDPVESIMVGDRDWLGGLIHDFLSFAERSLSLPDAEVSVTEKPSEPQPKPEPAPVPPPVAKRPAAGARYDGPPVSCDGRKFRTPGFLRSHRRQTHDILAESPRPASNPPAPKPPEPPAIPAAATVVIPPQPPRPAATAEEIDRRRAAAAASAIGEFG